MSLRVARDPFARGEYLRETVANTDRAYDCQWCGQKPTRLHTYTWQNDSLYQTTGWRDDTLFCNLKCYRAYNM